MSAVRVRPARPSDAQGIAEVHVQSWRAAYAHLLPADWLAALSVPERQLAWTRRIEGLGERSACFVADLRGEVVGFSHGMPTRDADLDGSTAEITSLYLHPARWGSGAGAALWAPTTGALAGLGHRRICLWVLEHNPRARAFYARCGLSPDGARKEIVLAGRSLSELRYGGSAPDLPFVEGYAAAIDAGDLQRVGWFLAPEVVWETPRGPVEGRPAVLADVAAAADQVARHVESQEAMSEVVAIGGDRYRVTVTRRLRHAGHAHVFRWQQLLTLPVGTGLTRLVHRDLPNQRSRLATFFRRAGIDLRRPPAQVSPSGALPGPD